MVLIVFLSSRISPLASTTIFCWRSPAAIAVATLAMLRTWSVRLAAIELTASVRLRQVPSTPRTSARLPRRPPAPPAPPARGRRSGPAGAPCVAGAPPQPRHLIGERAQLVDNRVDRVLELED